MTHFFTNVRSGEAELSALELSILLIFFPNTVVLSEKLLKFYLLSLAYILTSVVCPKNPRVKTKMSLLTAIKTLY